MTPKEPAEKPMPTNGRFVSTPRQLVATRLCLPWRIKYWVATSRDRGRKKANRWRFSYQFGNVAIETPTAVDRKIEHFALASSRIHFLLVRGYQGGEII